MKSMTMGHGTRLRALAVGLATVLVLAGCSPDPESVPDRAPGPAGARVSVSGDGVRGIRAEVLGWEPSKNNALPPERTIRVQARFLGEREWSLAGTAVELAVCAVDGERAVVRCGTIGN